VRERFAIAVGLMALALAAGNAAIASSTRSTVIGSAIKFPWDPFLVGPDHHSVYMWCTGWSGKKCPGRSNHAWLPLIAHGRLLAEPHSQVNAGGLGTVSLSNRQRQVIYYGHRLYYYRGDRKPGQTNGQAKHQGQGIWLLVSARGGGPPTNSTY
jgi:predicted lipoprotein with Yx(FWY)xxD motif